MVVTSPVTIPQSVGLSHLWGDLDPSDTPGIQAVWKIEPRAEQSTFLYTLTIDGEELEQPIIARAFCQKHTGNQLGFRAVMLDLAKFVAPRLYEYDPRTGIGITLGGEFPVSPLFDRPNYNVGLEAQLFTEKEHYEGERCPFCNFFNNESSVWGGGNVGWTHASCAPWIVPRTWKLQ